METRHEACSAEGQPRNILTSIRTDSQAAAPRCHVAVIALSTDVAHFYAISHRISPARRLEVASRGAIGAAGDRVNGTPKRRRICSVLEQAGLSPFINSKPRCGMPRAIESPLSRMIAFWAVRPRGMALKPGWVAERGKRDARAGSKMLNIPTLWMVFVSNYLALGLIWAYVARSYPKFDAARFWAGASFAGAAGAALATLHVFFPDTLLPLLAGGSTMVFAAGLGMMGIERFYGLPTRWRETVLIAGLCASALAFFIYSYPNTGMRILIFSFSQVL